jgi:hypothetical protein
MKKKNERLNRLEEKLSATQFANPWTLMTNQESGILDILNPDVDQFKWDIKKEEIAIPSALTDLKYIFADVLAGDESASTRPEFQCLNVPQMLKAIDWLLNNGEMSEVTKAHLVSNPWSLSFKSKPPTMEEFLVESYVGDIVHTMYDPVKKTLIEFWDPLKPYRTLVLEPHISWGKDQPLTEKIFETEKKWFYMGDAKIGQKVLTPFGTQTKISMIHPQGFRAIYKLRLSNGKEAKCGLNHLWNVSYRKDEFGHDIWENKETKFLIENKHKYKFKIISID